ncbi:MAG TPA: hypothetical protein VEZ42_04070 [Pseudonocardia sp.]|nr:hypothetical protein [Pseudonocardia sp.]
MTATAHSRPTAAAPPTGRALRVALAVAAPIAPLAVGLSRIIAPYGSAGDGSAVLDAVAASPGAVDAMLWLRLPIALLLVPGVLAAGLAALPGAPRLATAALLVAVPGWSAALVMPDTDGLARALVDTGTDRAVAVRLFDAVAAMEHPAVGVAVLLFVLGHIVGTVLLGLALWRSRAVPAWAGIVLAVSQPLHFVAFVVLANVPLDAAAYAMTAVGFGAAGLALARR